MHQTSSHRSILIDIGRKSRVLLAYSHARRNVKNIKCGLPQSRASVVLARSRGAPGAEG
jgi:hypothetical protein